LAGYSGEVTKIDSYRKLETLSQQVQQDQDCQRRTLCLTIAARLFLAGGAVKRAAITDCDPLDDRRASSAFFPRAVVNPKVALKLPSFVVGGAVI